MKGAKWMKLMQFTYGSQVEVQILRVQVEALCQLVDSLLELHQGDADALDLFRRQSFFFEAPDGLALHEFADEFDEAQDEFDHRTLDIVRIRIPTKCGGLWVAFGSPGCRATFARCETSPLRPSSVLRSLRTLAGRRRSRAK